MYGIRHAFRSRVVWIWVLGGLSLAAIGLVKVLAIYKQGFDLGDGSTFYAFSHFLGQGEKIYDDFIHFRTPGSYFLWSLILQLGNGTLAAMKFALNFETNFLYQAVLFLSIGVLFKWKRPWLAIIVTLACILLPGYLQLRAAFALLTVVLYIRAETSIAHKTIWLVATGIVAALSFTFGQEAGAVAITTVGLYELSKLVTKKPPVRDTVKRVGWLIAGFAAGILPLLIYAVFFSNISNFLYYSLYYAFVLQPQGMNLPFPALTPDTFIYYLPFLLIVLCLGAFYLTRSKTTQSEDKAFLLITILAILRLVTLVGRTDMGHLIFVVPELILLSAWTVSRLFRTKIERGLDISAAMALLSCLLGLLFSTRVGSIGLLLAAVSSIILFNITANRKLLVRKQSINLYPAVLIAAAVAVGMYAFMPIYYDQLRQVKSGITGSYKLGKTYYKGVYADPAEIDVITQVENEINKLHPRMLFSFPIQAYFYTDVAHHATKFLTYEPQTTLQEEYETISDLERNKPEVVIFDPAQALDLSASLSKISDYILSNYKIEKVVTGKRIIWVMVPLSSGERGGRKLVFDLYQDNAKAEVIGLQNPEKSVNNAVAQSATVTAKFTLNSSERIIKFSLYSDDKQDACGTVHMMRQSQQISEQSFCGTNIPYSMAVPSGSTEVQLTTEDSIIWNDLTVEGGR